MPKRTRSQKTGFRAEAFVDKVVSDAGFIWNDRQRDFGIDGDIGVVDAEGKVTGESVLTQVKGTEVGFPGENDSGFRFICKEDQIDYWLQCGQPVVLICVNLVRQEGWWKRLDTWFADPGRRAHRVVEFDKESDRFDVGSATSIAAICTPAGHPLPRLAVSEELTSNLLRVTGFAPHIHCASTPCRERGDAWERMRSNGSFESGFVLYDGGVYSMAPLHEGPLAVLCDGPVESFPTKDWSDTDDVDLYRRFVALLNFTLRAIHHRDLVWHAKKKIVYFQATKDLSPKRIKGGSRRGRGAFQPYFDRDDATKVRYCRHYAADLYFRRWVSEWFLEITPDYHFTLDGKRDSLYDAEYVKKIKRLERNSAVFALVRAWADFIRGEDSLFSRRDSRLSFGELVSVTADAGIDERVWLPPAAVLDVVGAPEDQALTVGLWDFQE